MTYRSTASTHPYLGLSVVALGASLAAMDIAVNVAFPAITAAFALELREIRWIVVFYVVTYACLMLAFGRLGDAIGHRQVFRAGLYVALAGYLGCAVAPDYGWLLLARIVQGVSTALVLSCGPALATSLFADVRRTHALGVYSAATALAATVAPILGGACIGWFGWSGVFWMRVPLVAIALAFVHQLPALHQVRHETDRYAVLLLLAVGIACLLLAPSLLGAQGSIPHAALLLIGAIASLAVFARQQRATPTPFFPRGLLRRAEFVLHNLASVVLQFAAFAVPLLVPYYLARIGGYGPTGIGAALALSPIGALIGSVLAAPCIRRFGTRGSALLAVVCLLLGTFGIASWPFSPLLAVALSALLLHGVGLGLFQVAYTDIVVASLPRTSRGVAGSLTMVTRTVGVVLAASALTGAMSLFGAEQASSAAADAAYAHAFTQVFGLLALLPGVVLAVAALRPRLFR